MSRKKSRQQDRRRLRRILNRNVDCVLQLGVSFTGRLMRERASHLDATGNAERRRLLRGHYDPVESSRDLDELLASYEDDAFREWQEEQDRPLDDYIDDHRDLHYFCDRDYEYDRDDLWL